MTTAVVDRAVQRPTATRAPLGRLLRSELRLVLRRPRTLVVLGLLALVPVVAGVGIAIAADSGALGAEGPNGGGMASLVEGNGLLLPVFSLVIAMTMLLPLVGAMLSADALAGEAANGTLRGLLVAPVGRARLLAVKAFGVAAVTLLAVLLMTVTGTVAGVVLLGGDGMLTISGTTLPFGAGLGRVLLFAALVTFQVWALAAVALAVSAMTEHPLVVVAVALGLVIVSGVLNAIPALDWLTPALITTSWGDLPDVISDPMPTGNLVEGVLRGGCYLVIGYSLALSRMLTRDG
ncbi:ABC transporter permease subunit [Actinokineospora pegani]|uniref:ABC transporter permease subunit n=1 Tax=Actinokineospora pegani TaxID=2654637 RepID=UPI0012EA9B47|nr:ABC transporter permease subunit [Actinokineospora pegani]